MREFLNQRRTLDTYWRTVILFGRRPAAARMPGRSAKMNCWLKPLGFGFNNVIDAFHIVNLREIPVRFFVDEALSPEEHP
jgi:hypothetical protein